MDKDALILSLSERLWACSQILARVAERRDDEAIREAVEWLTDWLRRAGGGESRDR